MKRSSPFKGALAAIPIHCACFHVRGRGSVGHFLVPTAASLNGSLADLDAVRIVDIPILRKDLLLTRQTMRRAHGRRPRA